MRLRDFIRHYWAPILVIIIEAAIVTILLMKYTR